MKCPFCTKTDTTKVVDSRLNQNREIIRRRRECAHCQGRFTTYERVEEVMPDVIKKDGRRETYSRAKLFGGIQMACQKRPVPNEVIENLVARIERRIQSFGLKEIPSRTVGELVMAALHKIDTVAYVRFASVYREFKDVDEFVSELQEVRVPDEGSPTPSSLAFPFVTEEPQPPETSNHE